MCLLLTIQVLHQYHQTYSYLFSCESLFIVGESERSEVSKASAPCLCKEARRPLATSSQLRRHGRSLKISNADRKPKRSEWSVETNFMRRENKSYGRKVTLWRGRNIQTSVLRSKVGLLRVSTRPKLI